MLDSVWALAWKKILLHCSYLHVEASVNNRYISTVHSSVSKLSMLPWEAQVHFVSLFTGVEDS